MNNRRAKTSLKKYTSHFIVRVRKGSLKVLLWEGVGDWTKTAIYLPPLLWPSALCLSRSPGLLNRRPRGPALCWMMAFFTASYHQLVWSPNSIRGPESPFCWVVAFPTTLPSNSSDLQLVWLPVSPSYIIVQSPTQSPSESLEWHVWSSSSGNNCHAVQWSLSSGASVY